MRFDIITTYEKDERGTIQRCLVLKNERLQKRFKSRTYEALLRAEKLVESLTPAGVEAKVYKIYPKS